MTVTSHIRFVQLFDWESEDKTRRLSFRVTAMLHAIKEGTLRHEFVSSPISVEFAEQWCKQRITNEYYCRNMSDDHMDRPVLGVWMEDETVLLIDGSHRYMARYWHNKPMITYCLVAFGDWQSFATETRL